MRPVFYTNINKEPMHLKKDLRISRTVLLFMILAAFLAGCDMLESDREASETDIELKNDAIYITPQTSGIIDLKSLVTAGAEVRLSVSSQPKYGKLESLGQDLLQYTANDGVTDAHDVFRVSIYKDNNHFLKEDSVIIIITPDTTAMPCGVWALTDYVYDVTGPVIINVLANDTACDVDSTALVVSLPDLLIGGVPMPKSYYGTLEVLAGGAIRYTPGAEFEGHDKFVYRLTKPANVPNNGDPEEFSHGFVYISTTGSCDSLELTDDVFKFKSDSINHMDSVYLDVTANDILCIPSNNLTFEVLGQPQGSVSYSWNNGFDYLFPAGVSAGFEDRFIYKVCSDNACDEAEVLVRLE
jgi:hypothetical protein